MAEIIVPSVGESITEVLINTWLKKVGDKVAKDEALVTLETDKVNVDVTAPIAGVLKRIVKAAGVSAAVGEVIGELEGNGASTAVAPSQQQQPTGASTAPATSGQTPIVMPAAARILSQHDTDVTSIVGTGPRNRITKADAQQATAPAVAVPAAIPSLSLPSDLGTPAASTREMTEVVPLSPMRKRIAERLVQVQHTAAILTTFNEVDMSAVMGLRERYQESFVKKHGIKLGFMSFFVKASIEALRTYPEVNAAIVGNSIEYHHYYNIGVAVGTEKGLVVPVLQRAELLGFAEVEQRIYDFGQRAKNGKLGLEDMQGGTFTITNGGVYGSLMSTPIINPPQTGILGMHGIVERPIGLKGQIVLRPMMYLALSYDHRLVDGRGAVLFLKQIKNDLEDPSRMLLEL